MDALLISDKDYETETFRRLYSLVCSCLAEKNFTVEHRAIGKGELKPCMGCFGCWMKEPGECVIHDGMAELNRSCMNSDVVVYLSPLVFGQFSANIKDAIDRWLPNMLPFFTRRPDGSTIHKPRYKTYPMQFVIGYGDSVAPEDAQLFTDITLKHRRNIEAVVFDGGKQQIRELFGGKRLERVDGRL